MNSMDLKTIAAELKVAILYKNDGENEHAVPRIAKILGLKRRTIYDYLDGVIKVNLGFIHAAVIATDGDPDIRRFLEPEGWNLSKTCDVQPDKDSLAAECLDDLPTLADFHGQLTDPKSTQAGVKRAMEKVKRELQENYVMWCRERGLKP